MGAGVASLAPMSPGEARAMAVIMQKPVAISGGQGLVAYPDGTIGTLGGGGFGAGGSVGAAAAPGAPGRGYAAVSGPGPYAAPAAPATGNFPVPPAGGAWGNYLSGLLPNAGMLANAWQNLRSQAMAAPEAQPSTAPPTVNLPNLSLPSLGGVASTVGNALFPPPGPNSVGSEINQALNRGMSGLYNWRGLGLPSIADIVNGVGTVMNTPAATAAPAAAPGSPAIYGPAGLAGRTQYGPPSPQHFIDHHARVYRVANGMGTQADADALNAMSLAAERAGRTMLPAGPYQGNVVNALTAPPQWQPNNANFYANQQAQNLQQQGLY